MGFEDFIMCFMYGIGVGFVGGLMSCGVALGLNMVKNATSI